MPTHRLRQMDQNHIMNSDIRDLFPVTRTHTYLLNAAQSPLNKNSQRAIEEYLHLAATDVTRRPSVREPVRELLATLLGGTSGDYALTPSTGAGIAMVAAGIRWRAGDNVVLPADEHWNNTFPWLRLRALGVDIRTVAPDEANRVTVDALAAKVDRNTKVLGVTAVRFDTGYRADLEALADLAHSVDALLVVDGIQCAGATAMNVERLGVDVMACGGFKWLLGMAGTGFLYVNQRARERISPVAPGMFAAEDSFTELKYHDDARRYETGSLAYSLLHGWAEGLRILERIGIDAIEARNRAMTDRMLAGLHALNFHILSPTTTPEERSAIVTFTAGYAPRNKAIAQRLADKGILVSYRKGNLRAAPNFYNTDAEIDLFLSEL